MKHIDLANAIAIASEAHKKQKDKAGQPYILHCLAVMNDVSHKSDDYKIVAILHDVVEDTNWTIKNLTEEGFNGDITFALNLLTHKEHVSYDDYIKAIATDKIATRVKLADLKHNSNITRLKGIKAKDIERMKKYHKSFLFLSAKYNNFKHAVWT